MARAPGGQNGNTNALKHGFYARSFRSDETKDLQEIDISSIDDEIKMLKVQARRIFQMATDAKDDESVEYESMLKTLAVLGSTATRIAGLMRTKKILSGEDGKTTKAISEALGDVIREMGTEGRRHG